MWATAIAAAGEHTLAATSAGVSVVGACGAGWKYDVPYNEGTILALAARCRVVQPAFGPGPPPRLVAGSFHNLAIQKGRLFAWGCDSIDENDGQLGLGSRTEVSIPTPVALAGHVVHAAAGAHHSLVLTEEGTVLTAGAGLLGQLGRRHDFSTDAVPSSPDPPKRLHAHDMFMPIELSLAPGESVVQVGCGYYHSLCVTSSGRLLAFGSNSHGQCGVGHNGGVMADGDQILPMPQCLHELAGQKIVQAVGGYSHTIALTADGRVWTCGGNSHGQRGLPMCEDEDLPACSEVDVGGPAAVVAAGYSHSVVLRRDGQVVTFGENDSGQLGIDGDDSAEPRVVPISEKCVGVAAGNSHTVALRCDGAVLSWGSGRNGQQGGGRTLDITFPTPLQA